MITAGTTLDDARAIAEEALSLHIEGMAEDEEAIPELSTLEEVMSDPDSPLRTRSQAPRVGRVHVERRGSDIWVGGAVASHIQGTLTL